jgi:hypothetical protein
MGIKISSCFSNGNRSRRAGLNTTFASQTVIEIYRHSFITLHLDHAYGTDIDALFITGALIGINFDFPTHGIHLSFMSLESTRKDADPNVDRRLKV